MTSENINFKSVFEKTLFNFNREKNNFTKAQLLREKEMLMFQTSLALEHSSDTSVSLLSAGLEEYRNFVKNNKEDGVNNYTAECINLLKSNSKKIDTSSFCTTLGNPDKYISKTECHGQYMDCKHDEVTKLDIQKLFEVKNKQHPVLHQEPSIKKVSKFIYQEPNRASMNIYHSPVATVNQTESVSPNTNVNMNLKPFHYSHIDSSPQNSTSPKSLKRKQDIDSGLSVFNSNPQTNPFRTGLQELAIQNVKKYGNAAGATGSASTTVQPLFAYGSTKKSLGGRRNVQSKFVPPVLSPQECQQSAVADITSNTEDVENIDERLKHIPPKMVELIRSEIMDKFCTIDWDDIAGLEYAKATIKEAVVWPILRPDIFTGLRRPPRGILLFGPPGTGKTLIGKCIASQSKSTFFSISASSLTSKWIGDGEKMVRALFAVASVHQPAVVFIDEIDSLLCQRSESDHESSRRLKTEFLVQLDGAATHEDERILVVGATNRPQELDEAARRRLVKRLYIPLPEYEARIQILSSLLKNEQTDISEEQIFDIGKLTNGFSGADMKTLCHEASMGPIRSIAFEQMHLISADDVRPVSFADFKVALDRVRASVSQDDLSIYIKWDKTYGSGAGK